MRTVSARDITREVRDLCISAAYDLEPDVTEALRAARQEEASPLGRDVLDQIIKNFQIAAEERAPICQDTGIAVVFIEVGREVALDGPLEEAVNEGIRQGYDQGYLRKSVCDPITRDNTGDNTPAIIHTTIVEGDRVRITLAPKGGGSENMSGIRMLKPAEGIEGIKQAVSDLIRQGGGNPCPPLVIGVGIGGNFEASAILAKKAALREVGSHNPDKGIARLETEMLEDINKLGIGPMGFGGTITALAVHVETLPCHIASLPVAVNVQCHADRHKKVEI